MDNSIHKIDIEIKKKIVNNDIDIKKGEKNQPDEKQTNKTIKGALEDSNEAMKNSKTAGLPIALS